MRPQTQRQHSHSLQKPQFRTKLKSRLGGVAQLKELNNTVDANQFIQTQRSKHDHQLCMTADHNFNKTASKLLDSNFGRHLCKLNVIKPDLTKNTIYQKSFYEQKAIPNVVNHDKEYDRLQGPHLDMNSTYREGFRGDNGDSLQRPIPQDLIKRNGPCPQLSSYSSQFPGYRGDNQYVKPTDRHHRGYFPLRSRSTYTKQFHSKTPQKDDYTYFPDQLRAKPNWFGKSTYENFCSNHNPQYFAKKVKIMQKLDEKPQFVHQYETTYRNDFIPKENPLCPSKIILETKAQGHYLERKGKFSQNADFKAISPEFHAISTSKHSYV